MFWELEVDHQHERNKTASLTAIQNTFLVKSRTATPQIFENNMDTTYPGWLRVWTYSR